MSTHFLTAILALTAFFGFLGLILAFLPSQKLYAVANYFYRKIVSHTLISSFSRNRRTEPSLGTKSASFSKKNTNQLSSTHTASRNRESADTEFTVLYLFSSHEYYTGFQLWDALQGAKLHYGSMRIFHAYDQVGTKGSQILFSVAGAIEPGYFDIHKIKEIQTPGLCLFMQNQQEEPLKAFHIMLKTANNLEETLGGIICDHHRQPLTQTTIEAYQQELREYSIK